MSTTTPNMSLTLPTPGDVLDSTWADELNTALTAIDRHNHSAGSGVKVTPAGLNINADVPFGSNNATGLRTVRLASQGSALALSGDLGCLYNVGGDLYYNNGGGTQIQLTAGGALNAASIGGIGGDYSTSTASVAYVSASKTFVFTQDAGKAANLDAGNLVVREPGVASANGVTVASPSGLGAPYTLTLPVGLPGSTQPLVLTSAGAISPASSLSISGTITSGDLIYGDSIQSGGTVFVGSTLSVVGAQSLGGNLSMTGSNPASTAGISNQLTPAGIPKCWAYVTCLNGTRTVQSGTNLASVTIPVGTSLRFTFATAMGNANYCVIASVYQVAGTALTPFVLTKTATYFDLEAVAAATGTFQNFTTATGLTYKIDLAVFGTQ